MSDQLVMGDGSGDGSSHGQVMHATAVQKGVIRYVCVALDVSEGRFVCVCVSLTF